MASDDDDAPAAVPEWEPSELAKRIASGHALDEHFPDLDTDALARLIEDAFERGERHVFNDRTMYWDQQERMIVIVNLRDPDGGTAFLSDRDFFEDWGRRWRSRS